MVFDTVLALVLAVVGVLDPVADTFSDDHRFTTGEVFNSRRHVVIDGVPPPLSPAPDDWIALMALSCVVAAPLVLRRRYPLAVLWILMGVLPQVASETPNLSYACVVAAYSAAVYSPYRLLTLVSLPAALLASQIRGAGLPSIPDEFVGYLLLALIMVTGHGLRTWRIRADESRARLAALEREQAEALRRAAEQERARIARELHDVVTHNVSVMVIQAGAARKVMDADPGQATEALLAVEAGGRAAMTELRHVMGLLTMDTDRPDAAPDLAPQPGLDRLEALVERVRDTGLPVDLTVLGQPHPVPAGIGLAAYRVVQETLTNTVKHAAGATASVIIEHTTDHLRIDITDTGGRPDAAAATGNGRGLIGLRERLTVYGGTLQTGPHPHGGYHVTALIPLETP
jgi:signal transduction histidine kinase